MSQDRFHFSRNGRRDAFSGPRHAPSRPERIIDPAILWGLVVAALLVGAVHLHQPASHAYPSLRTPINTPAPAPATREV